KVLGGTAQQIGDRLHTLYLDLTKAANFQPGRHGQYALLNQIGRDNSRLFLLAKRRDQLTSQLKAANQRLADLQTASAQERATVASAVTGGFNITSAGQFQSVGGRTQANPEKILAELLGNVAQARRFANQLALLRKRGLSSVLLRQLGEAGY